MAIIIGSMGFAANVYVLIAFVTTWLFVKETFVRTEEKVAGMKEVWEAVPEKSLTVTLFATFFMLSVAMYSVEPILTVYVKEISQTSSHVALLAGIIFSASGLANILAAPRLGKLSDRIGAHKVMLTALLAAGILFIPQAFARSPWELMGLRFLLGLAAGGLNPSVNTLIKKITPGPLTGRVYGFSMAAGYLGVFAGSVLGGQVAAWLGIPYVFLMTSALLLINAAWVYAKVYKKLREPSHSAIL